MITTLAQPDFLSYFCENAANYTQNSMYQRTLNFTLSTLRTTNNGFGFYNFSTGGGKDTVNSIALCRGDVNPDSCQTCLNNSIVKLQQLCPNQKEAVGYYNYCLLKYSNENILGSTRIKLYKYVANPQNSTDIVQLNWLVGPLLTELRVHAAAGGPLRKFATGNRSGPGFATVYALVQCTPDLSGTQCSGCLADIIQRIGIYFNGKVGGAILAPMCNFRYETYRFFNQSAPVAPSSPPVLQLSPPVSQPSPSPSPVKTRRSMIMAVIAIVTVIIILLIASLCIFIRLRKKKRKLIPSQVPTSVNSETLDIDMVESLRYEFNAVKAATNNFSEENKLGRGGFGTVYKGKLEDGNQIAVKRLAWDSRQGDLEFKNEVLLVAKLQHRNLVRLQGFSKEGSERLLIYEYMPNASLDQFIFDPTKRIILDWEKRYNIINGIAKGLLYLHEDSRLRIIHRDMKASNVLLDENMTAKIADFGMARLFKTEETQGDTNRIVGTYGYMAPEYAMHGQFSVKSDVYSYGVLLLEIVTSQKNQCFKNGERMEDLLSVAWKSWKNGTTTDIIDPILKTGSNSLRDISRCVHIGLLCVQEKVVNRPTMATVVLMLNSFSFALPMPLKYAFFIHNNIHPEIPLLRSVSSKCSTNEVSICSKKLYLNRVHRRLQLCCRVAAIVHMNTLIRSMIPPPFQQIAPAPWLPPAPPVTSGFWNASNVQGSLKELQKTLRLAEAMEKELEMLVAMKGTEQHFEEKDDGAKEAAIGRFSKFLEDSGKSLDTQEKISLEAANGLIMKLRNELEPFRVITDDKTPWEEKSAVVRLSNKMQKHKRNKLWRKRKRRRNGEMLAKEREQFDRVDQEADEWRAREIAKEIAKRKVEKMKEIAKQKANEERRRLESELELLLIVEKLQELRSIRIQKLTKQGHFLPDEDNKFLEKIRAAVEEEERQAMAAADTCAAKDAIATAEESRNVTGANAIISEDQTDLTNREKINEEKITETEAKGSSMAAIDMESEKQRSKVAGSTRGYDYSASLPLEFYHYYHGSNTDMGTLIEVRRTWDAYIRPGGSRIPGHWVQPPPPADEIWASYLVKP
ncbi:hypothetical protein SSX86_006870 [Deinandra increscens subsp. villosa]|uniref:Uncharacterized protein n=1 Tax=Deinandra increscens subsp. villosa TaxID=3103831 RepID=A0AAP0DNM6_9ASTR